MTTFPTCKYQYNECTEFKCQIRILQTTFHYEIYRFFRKISLCDAHFIGMIHLKLNHYPFRKGRLHSSEGKNYTGQYTRPSRISDLCGTVAGMVTPKGSMSTEGETLQVSVPPYMCSICPPLVTRQMSIL